MEVIKRIVVDMCKKWIVRWYTRNSYSSKIILYFHGLRHIFVLKILFEPLCYHTVSLTKESKDLKQKKRSQMYCVYIPTSHNDQNIIKY